MMCEGILKEDGIQTKIFAIEQDDSNRRLDRLIRIFLPHIPLPQVYAAIRKGLVRINGKKTAANYKTKQGDMLSIALFLFDHIQTEPAAARPVSGKNSSVSTPEHAAASADSPVCSILLHTADLLIVNKAAGIAVHGENSLQSLLFESLPCLRCAHGLAFRMGALHRLDKDTSGIICFSQSLLGAQWFSQCLREKSIKKYYIGIVEGRMPDGTIATHEKGEALTHCTRLAYNRAEQLSCMLFTLVTGRKHQIRKYAQHAGHPLIGDIRYGSTRSLVTHQSYVLHAWRLYFPHGRLPQLPACVEADCPRSVKTLLDTLFPHWYAGAVCSAT